LADEKYIERRMQRLRDFKGNRYAAARQAENHHVRLVAVGQELCRQLSAGIGAILKEHGFFSKRKERHGGRSLRRSYAAWKCLWHLGFFDGLDFVERVERVRLVKEQEGVVAPRQNGGNIVAGFVLGVIDHADRALAPR